MTSADPLAIAELTTAQAHFIMCDAARKHDCAVRDVTAEADHDSENGWIVVWSADVFDPELPAGADLLGTICFLEHYAEPVIHWH